MDKSWLGNVVEEIRFDFVELSCVKHEANKVAHLLASLSLFRSVQMLLDLSLCFLIE